MPAREDGVVEMRREDDSGRHVAESRGSKLRLALLAPVQELVPPPAYGGVESVVATLADGFVAAGHDVTLFARHGSTTTARLVTIVADLPTAPARRLAAELDHALECLLDETFDVVSSHAGMLGAALEGEQRLPVLHTVSDPMDRTRAVWAKLARHARRLRLISVSHRQQALAPDLPWLACIPNPVDIARFAFQPRAGDYLAFVGRMSPDKGCHHAIAVARRAGLPLRIAAKLRDEREHAYFDRHVRPQLQSGAVDFLGELAHADKVELLRNALATLFPIEVEEAFGLVLVESMACGTPVVGFRRGAVPEIVAEGRTGFVVDDMDGMLRAVARIDSVDRAGCRRHVEATYSVERVVSAYVRCFEDVLQSEPAEPWRRRSVSSS